MNKGKILLQPMGGLANRMRVISVLFELCCNVEAEFEVLWVNNDDCGASWRQLFKEPPFIIKEINGSYIHAYRSKRWYRRLPHLLWMFYHKYTWLSNNDVCALTAVDTPENSAKIRLDWECRLRNGERMFVVTGDNLGPVNDLSMFTPIDGVCNYVNEFWEECASVYPVIYGLHIRRTDNIWSINSSPLELFEKKICDVLMQNPSSAFYLASDDEDTVSELKAKFGDKVIVRAKELSRKTSVGMQNALIDMLLLGKCKKIFGSYFSSFSEMASWIGGVELEIIKKN